MNVVLPHLSRHVAAMVRLQALTGCRPGEICVLRPCDVDRDGEVWEYRPGSHKTEHHDRSRVVYIGPRAQQILAPWLEDRPAEAYCFSPAEVCAEIGGAGAWMVAVIASAEDERRYTRPVLMSNDQLQAACGLGSAATLIKVRQRAIDAGWLHYEAGHKGKIGVYWVLIPDYAAALETGNSPTAAETGRGDSVQEVKRKRQGKRSDVGSEGDLDSRFTARSTSGNEEKATPLIPYTPNGYTLYP